MNSEFLSSRHFFEVLHFLELNDFVVPRQREKNIVQEMKKFGNHRIRRQILPSQQSTHCPFGKLATVILQLCGKHRTSLGIQLSPPLNSVATAVIPFVQRLHGMSSTMREARFARVEKINDKQPPIPILIATAIV